MSPLPMNGSKKFNLQPSIPFGSFTSACHASYFRQVLLAK